MADMIPDKIQTAKGAFRFLNNASSLIVLSQVGHDAGGRAAGVDNLRHHTFHCIRVEVHDADRSTFTRKTHGSRPTHTGARSRNHTNFTFESHVS